MGIPQAARVDLHRHLEGSVRLETLIEVAKDYRIPIPSEDPKILGRYYKILDDPPSFLNYLSKFIWISNFYVNKEVIERVAYEAVVDAAQDAVTHLELRFSPAHFARREKFPLDKVTEYIVNSGRKAAKEHSINVSFIATIARHIPMEVNNQAFDVVMEMRDLFVGLDLAGNEQSYNAHPFIPMFLKGKEVGLGITIHAGEGGPAHNIKQAITELKADRIGHGTRIIESPEVMKLALENNTVLEMCITSNVQTNTIPSAKKHPLKFLLEEGLKVTLNTDNTHVSSVTLSKEIEIAQKELGMTDSHVKTLTKNSLSALFNKERVCN